MLTKKHFPVYACLLILFSSACKKKGEDCVYLIPKYFEGNLLLVYEQKEGADILYEGKTRVYKFDTTGVLKTKFSPNYGIQSKFYYYVDSTGKRAPIDYVLSGQVIEKEEVVCVNNETGNDFDNNKQVRRHFELFTIAKWRNIDSISSLRDIFLFTKLE